jgi:hypothetical protein
LKFFTVHRTNSDLLPGTSAIYVPLGQINAKKARNIYCGPFRCTSATRQILPAVSAAAVAAVAAAASTTAATAVAAATAAVTTATAAAKTAVFTGLGLIDLQVAAIEFFAIELSDSILGVGL